MNPQRSDRRRIPLDLLMMLVALDVAMRLLEKAAVVGSLQTHTTFALGLLRQPWWWIGIALGPFQLWVWTGILARTELSIAYPLSSIAYPLTMVAAWLVFHEHLSGQVWVGAAFMTVGVAIVGSAARPSVRPLAWSDDRPEISSTNREATQSSAGMR